HDLLCDERSRLCQRRGLLRLRPLHVPGSTQWQHLRPILWRAVQLRPGMQPRALLLSRLLSVGRGVQECLERLPFRGSHISQSERGMDAEEFDAQTRSLTGLSTRRRPLLTLAAALGVSGIIESDGALAGPGKCPTVCDECAPCKKGNCKKVNGKLRCTKGKCK